MSFITPFFLSSVQKQLQPSSVGSANADAADEPEEIYHNGHSEGKTVLFQPKSNKVSLKSLNMAPIKSKVFDMLNHFTEENPRSGSQTFKLPDEPDQT
jgi:hypothetical protein